MERRPFGDAGPPLSAEVCPNPNLLRHGLNVLPGELLRSLRQFNLAANAIHVEADRPILLGSCRTYRATMSLR
jgi:hypothetical protein